MSNWPSHVHLSGQRTSLIIALNERLPAISYYGKKISTHSTFEMILALSTRQEAKCAVKKEAPISLTPTLGAGFTGSTGVNIDDGENAWSVNGDIVGVEFDENRVKVRCEDTYRGLALCYHIELDKATDVVSAATEIINLSEQPKQLHWLCAPCIPVPAHMSKIMSFEGRWAKEFHRKSIDRFLGSYVRENRKGHTSHDAFPSMILHDDFANEANGECYGFHLGWSGNHRMLCEQLSDGRGFAQLGELLLPGEMSLAQGESYKTPELYICFADQGFNQMSASFHQYMRQHIIAPSVKQSVRQIHYNTWEAIYFDHDTNALASLAEQAAAIGAERFVLDDGWFKGRRGDNAGLGDWTVDSEIYPHGLQPLIDKVLATGMSFGIWFEPEMVNPDSDLFRNHPDWVLQTAGNEQLNFRNQLVLDLTQKAVCNYLFDEISAILREYNDISYIKWDMNRDLNHAGNIVGKGAVHQQTQAVYTLIDRLKIAYPNVEIESCSSGGGRIDFGILKRTDRFWTSDSNDALDRVQIQRGCSYFFPPEIMGAHVGPRHCHITGRVVSMEMRAAVALFGHMGMEMDPRELDDHERETLTKAFTLHKKHRQLIHNGELIRLTNNELDVSFAVRDSDSSKALYAYYQLAEPLHYCPNKFLFKGLDESANYRLDLVWPSSVDAVKQYSASVLSSVDGDTFTGELLANHGMQIPVLDPQSALVFELTKI